MVGPNQEPPSAIPGGGNGLITVHREGAAQHPERSTANHRRRRAQKIIPQSPRNWGKRHPSATEPSTPSGTTPAPATHTETQSMKVGQVSLGNITTRYTHGLSEDEYSQDRTFYNQEAHNGQPMMKPQTTRFQTDGGRQAEVQYPASTAESDVHGATAAAGRTPRTGLKEITAQGAVRELSSQTPTSAKGVDLSQQQIAPMSHVRTDYSRGPGFNSG